MNDKIEADTPILLCNDAKAIHYDETERTIAIRVTAITVSGPPNLAEY